MQGHEQTIPGDGAREDGADRWPVPYAAAFVVVSSAALWALIIAGGRWLLT